MISVLLWIVGCYVLAAAVVHAASRLTSKQERHERHYVLVTGNEEPRMEWYMRSLFYFSFVTGKEVKVTVVDIESEDDTLPIVRLLAKDGMNVDIQKEIPVELALSKSPTDEAEDDEGRVRRSALPVLIDLSNAADIAKLPLF